MAGDTISLSEYPRSDDPIGDLIDRKIPSFEILLDQWLKVRVSDPHGNIQTAIPVSSRQGLEEYAKAVPFRISRLRSVWYDELNTYRDKDGGRLFFRPDGLIINTPSCESADIWNELVFGVRSVESVLTGKDKRDTPVPVAPFVLHRDGRPYQVPSRGKMDVLSRYCGLSVTHLDWVLKKASVRLTNDPDPASRTVRTRIFDLLQIIGNDWKAVVNTLEAYGFLHDKTCSNHTHPSNFTVEFVRLDTYREWSKRLCLNTAYDQQSVTFDVRDYLKNPSLYKPVVRIIDFDHIGLDFRTVENQVEAALRHNRVANERISRLLASDSHYERCIGILAAKHAKQFDPSWYGILLCRYELIQSDIQGEGDLISDILAKRVTWPEGVWKRVYELLAAPAADRMLKGIGLLYKRQTVPEEIYTQLARLVTDGRLTIPDALRCLSSARLSDRALELLRPILNSNDDSDRSELADFLMRKPELPPGVDAAFETWMIRVFRDRNPAMAHKIMENDDLFCRQLRTKPQLQAIIDTALNRFRNIENVVPGPGELAAVFDNPDYGEYLQSILTSVREGPIHKA